MKKLLEFLWSGCFHEWEIESKKHLFLRSQLTNELSELPIAETYVLRCKKCGELKTFNTYF